MATSRDLAVLVGNLIRTNGYQIANFEERVDQSIPIIEEHRQEYPELDEEMASLIGDNLIMMVWCTHLSGVDDLPDRETNPLIGEFHTLRDVVIDAVCEFYGIEEEGGEYVDQGGDGVYEDDEDGDGLDA